MDTANLIQVKATDADAVINCNLVKFGNELLENLRSCKLNFAKSCFEGKKRIEELKGNNIKLSMKMYQQDCVASIYKNIDYMKDKALNYAHNMYSGEKLTEVYMARYNEVYLKSKRSLEEQNVQKYDEYTMMPYHDVENKIDQLNIKIKQLNEEADQTYQKTKTLCISMEKDRKKTLQDTKIFNIYHKEQRIELQHLKELSWENPILQMDLYKQKIAQVQKEIVELETQIKSDTNPY